MLGVLSSEEGRLCADASCPSVAGMTAGVWLPPPRGLLLPVALMVPGLPEAAASLLLALGLPQGLHPAIKAAPAALDGLAVRVIRLALPPPVLPAVLAFAAVRSLLVLKGLMLLLLPPLLDGLRPCVGPRLLLQGAALAEVLDSSTPASTPEPGLVRQLLGLVLQNSRCLSVRVPAAPLPLPCACVDFAAVVLLVLVVASLFAEHLVRTPWLAGLLGLAGMVRVALLKALLT